MISNQILQNTINGLKNITKCDISVIEREGKVIVSTEDNMIGRYIENLESFMLSPAEGQSLAGYNYFKVFDNNVAEYVVAAKGEDVDSYRVGQLAAFNIQTLLIAYKERYDKDNFIKNLLLDNLLLVDIYGRAKKLHIENNIPRIVYLIETELEREINVVEMVRNIFPTRVRDFVSAVDENCIILVKELKEKDGQEEIEKTAQIIYDSLRIETNSPCYVAIGTIVNDLKFVSSSYKEAKMALEVGKIFDPEKAVINYDKLGIGRLIYQLPISLCRMFVDEVLHGITVEQFDEETLTTVNKFFENNLNVSETSRQIYIHRNTLVYRLDKLQKMTGLDLRNFDDAIVFKITLMVSKYMAYKAKFIF
ncbi:MAG: helix-turn-helix domain-containing protein [Clostridiales bacterium]|jgi:carbohydrate diacid regulator|nr:helix-turn-helix domain-containing protein [Clostridiales bacterium]